MDGHEVLYLPTTFVTNLFPLSLQTLVFHCLGQDLHLFAHFHSFDLHHLFNSGFLEPMDLTLSVSHAEEENT